MSESKEDLPQFCKIRRAGRDSPLLSPNVIRPSSGETLKIGGTHAIKNATGSSWSSWETLEESSTARRVSRKNSTHETGPVEGQDRRSPEEGI